MRFLISNKHERGATLVFAVFFAIIILMIAAIALGLGFVATNKSRVQNVANLVALSALEIAVKEGSSWNVAAQADAVLAMNKIPGIAEWSSFTKTVAEGGAGHIIFGTWYFADPDGEGFGVDPCFDGGQVGYPCFVKTDDGAYRPGVNSVKITLIGNSSTNMVVAPFLKVFGASARPFNTGAIATLAGQCSVILMDVSRSMTYDTHKQRYPFLNLPPGVNPSQFIYHLELNGPNMEQNPNCPSNPSVPRSSFCDLKSTREETDPVDAMIHFRSDYRLANSIGNQYLIVDRFVSGAGAGEAYRGPQPMNDLFRGVNAGLRKLYERSRGSLWRGIGFAGLTADSSGFMPNAVPKVGFGADPGALIQVTNMGNMGTFDIVRSQVSPPIGGNFLSHGWYAPPFFVQPTYSSVEDPSLEQTNLSGAIELALDWFDGRGLNTGLSCPVNYQKTIYLMTDGMINCVKTATAPAYTCVNNYFSFAEARDQLLTTIVPELQRKKIRVNVVMTGETVGTHFINIRAPIGFTTASGSKFLSPQEAIANGYGAYNHPYVDQKMVDELPSVDTNHFPNWCQSVHGGGSVPCAQPYKLEYLNDYAMQHAGNLGVTFREPVSVMAQLAIDTGGVFCPALPLAPSGYEVMPNGKTLLPDEKRLEGKAQIYTVEKKTIPEQILECFDSNWSNKFILVAKEALQEIAGPQPFP
jgi:hypothetical protein